MKYLRNEEVLAQYILDNSQEVDDYEEHCKENNFTPYIIDSKKLPKHILEYAALIMWGSGYDMEGWIIK